MRDTLKFIIQVAVIVFVGWFLVKFTTIDDSIISFFRANSTVMTGNVSVINNGGDIVAGDGASCTTPWGETLNHGTYIIAYESTQSCKYEKRFCNNGYLEGTYSSDHCNSPEGIIQKTVVKPVISKIAYGYVQGTTQSNYSSPSLTNGNGTVTIINSWNNTKGNPTTISANDSNYKKPTAYKNYDLTQHGCTTPWGSYIDSSEWVIAYKSPKPAYAGASCTYERRTCFQGTLGGSYIYPTCTLANNNTIYNNYGQDYYYPTSVTNRSCITPWGQSVRNGSRVYAYRSSYSSSSYGCQGEYRTCRNGYLDGSYQYSSCNNYDNGCHYGNCGGNDYGRSCSLPWGGSIADGSSVTAYNNSSAPCSSERRTCRNGYLEGSYQYSSCNNTPTYSSCSLPWGGSIQNGQTVEAYQNSSAPCYKEVRTCYNGSLGGSFQYASCNPGTNPTGGSDTYGSWQSAGDKEGNVDSLDTCNSNATSPYTCGSESSNSCTDYQKINCTSFSPMICSYQTRAVSCVK